MQPFVSIPVDHELGQGGAYTKFNSRNDRVAEGAVHGVAVDAKGNVYVADRQGQRVAVFDESGKEIGQIAVSNPHQIAVHPKTGAIYVMTRTCTGYWQYKVSVQRFEGFSAGTVAAAKYEFGMQKTAAPQMALAASDKGTKVMLSGVAGDFVALVDKGNVFEVGKTQFAAQGEFAGGLESAGGGLCAG